MHTLASNYVGVIKSTLKKCSVIFNNTKVYLLLYTDTVDKTAKNNKILIYILYFFMNYCENKLKNCIIINNSKNFSKNKIRNTLII